MQGFAFDYNWADVCTIVAKGAARVCEVGIETEVVSLVRVRRMLRGRPVVAFHTSLVENGVVTFARCWQEDATTVFFTGELATCLTIQHCPFVSAVVEQFFYMVYSWHQPRAVPLGLSHVVTHADNVVSEVVAGRG